VADPLLAETDTCHDAWPVDAVDVDALAQRLTGTGLAPEMRLWDVFDPGPVGRASEESIAGRGQTRQILAQFEGFLNGHRRPGVAKPHVRPSV
jgi:hypothetical protein